MFNPLWNRFVSLIDVGTRAEEREREAYLAQAKTLSDLECRQRELERGSAYTHILSG